LVSARVKVPSKIGSWVIEGDSDGVDRIYLPHELVTVSTGAIPRTLSNAARQLSEYFAGRRRHFDIDLHLVGTPFQQDVWNETAQIPYGEVRSYGDVAIAIGRPHAFRAVGNANGANPWPIVVPCHRVVSSVGIGGYGGGLDVKRFLLSIEGVTY
jgi:O-6-methylguanine DNA methyltransferase